MATMLCPHCNTSNRDEAKFCRKCGAKLAWPCPRCGLALPANAAFCDACGTQVTAPPTAREVPRDTIPERIQRYLPQGYAERLLAAGGQMAGQRRIVTILFCDIKGSSAMARGMDPEDVMDIMDGAFDVLIPPIMRYEGTLARLMGDAILAFFGAPIAHEDDPERACRAALEIVEGARAYAGRLQEKRAISGFNVRVGIHTGLVVVGEVGSDLRVEYTAMGETINLASRLESAAEPGTVLVSAEPHKHIAPLFDTQSLPPIDAKGWDEPVPVFRVLSAKDVPGKVRGIEGLQSELVGREAEFAALTEALERLHAGEGTIVTIVGEAGIGKSRLVAELRSAWAHTPSAQPRIVGAHGRAPLPTTIPTPPDEGPAPARATPPTPPQWLEGRCLSYGSSMAYLLWLDVLRYALGAIPDNTPDSLSTRLHDWLQDFCPDHFDEVQPYLARLLSLPLHDTQQKMLDDLDGQTLRDRTFAATQTVLRCSAQRQPLVLVLEDLHWADSTSLALLEHLLPLVQQVPLLITTVARPYRDHGSWRLRQAIADRFGALHTDLMLEPLSTAHSETLVANLLRVGGLPEALTQRILARAEGNPFYVEEVIRSLLDQEIIVQDQTTGRWLVTREVAQIAIPDTLHGVLLARIDRLREDTKRVLQMASVIGRIFLYRLLAAIAAADKELDTHLSSLQREEMIRERSRLPELEYIFKHELTREAAYYGLLKKQRRVFHLQVAEALEEQFSQRLDEVLGLLAHHWERAGDAQRAIQYLLRAGDQARLLYAHDEAVDAYERALVFLREGDDHDRTARTLMKLGLTYQTAFDIERSRMAYDEGLELWQQAAPAAAAATLPPAPHPLRVQWWGGEPDSIRWSDHALLARQLFSGLARLTPQLGIVPDVARRWDMLEGGQRYIFHLRGDVRWSDGTPVTAGDFECAWKHALAPASDPSLARLLYDIKGAMPYHQGQETDPDTLGIQAVDELTLAVHLEGPTGYFLQLVACGATYPRPRHVVDSCGEAWSDPENLLTNGPYRLESWARRRSIILARNPDYHGQFAGNVHRVEFPFCQYHHSRDSYPELTWYEGDNLDVLSLFAYLPEEKRHLRHRWPEQYFMGPQLRSPISLVFNVTRFPFDDPRVRRACVHATDREGLANDIMQGTHPAALDGFVPPGMPGHSPGIGLRYDPQLARHLLAEAGYPDGRGFPVLQEPWIDGPHRKTLADYLREQWSEQLGIDLRLEPMSVPAYRHKTECQLPRLFFDGGWSADYPDPDNLLRVGFPWEWTGWRNATYDRLVEKARRLMDQEERMKLYRQADLILVQDAAVMPVGYWRYHVLIKPWVRGFVVSASGEWDAKDVFIGRALREKEAGSRTKQEARMADDEP